LPSGDLLTACFAGEREAAGDTAIWLSIRRNGAWLAPRRLLAERGLAHWNPVLHAEGERVWRATTSVTSGHNATPGIGGRGVLFRSHCSADTTTTAVRSFLVMVCGRIARAFSTTLLNFAFASATVQVQGFMAAAGVSNDQYGHYRAHFG